MNLFNNNLKGVARPLNLKEDKTMQIKIGQKTTNDLNQYCENENIKIVERLTSENKALNNKVKQLEEGVKFAKTMGNLTKLSLIKLEEERSEIYDLLVGNNGVKRYTHEEIVLFITNKVETI